jgi:DNA-binding transcriptional ArsR family regulator
MAVSSKGNAAIVWTDNVDNSSTKTSVLYLLRFNSTRSEQAAILITHDSQIIWPSLALGSNGTSYLVWTQYFSDGNRAMVEYASVSRNRLSRTQLITSYNDTQLFMPKARLIFDQLAGRVLIAWGASHFGDQPVSTVDYAKLGTNGTVLMKLQVARFGETLQDLSITPSSEQGGAYVVWETNANNDSVYVSHISSAGQLVYLKRLDYPNALARYLSASADSQGNLYVFSYQPSGLSLPHFQATNATSVAYLRIDSNGDIVQAGSQLITGGAFAVTSATDGDLYAVSPTGIVIIATPPHNQVDWYVVGALMGSLAIGVTFSAEEGRYRLLSACSKMPWVRAETYGNIGQKVVHLLGRKPGLRVRDLNKLINTDHIDMFGLTRMERLGVISSFRDGLSRRFYVKNVGDSSIDPIASRILRRILECPGTWEAQLVKDLGLSQQLVHYHLKRLRDSRLVTSTSDKEGPRKLYRFAGKTQA